MIKTRDQALISYYYGKAIATYRAGISIIKQRIKNPQWNILGAYHCLNVGDMSLGKAIELLLAKEGLFSAHLISLPHYKRYVPAKFTILGGGAIMQPNNLYKLWELSRGNQCKTAIVGVDIGNISDEYRSFIRELNCVSCRGYHLNNEQRESLQKRIGRKVIFHPDLAFSLYSNHSNLSDDCEQKKIGINLLPWHFRLKKSKWIPEDCSRNYFGRFSKQEGNINLGKNYIQLIKEVISYYKSMGYVVYHFPFAIEDDLFARTVLSQMDVIFLKYSSDPEIVLDRMNKLSLFIATRLHAHIFALIKQVPLLSIAYGTKCESLFRYIQKQSSDQITQNDFLRLENNLEDQMALLLSKTPVVLSKKQLEFLSSEVSLAVAQCIHSMLD